MVSRPAPRSLSFVLALFLIAQIAGALYVLIMVWPATLDMATRVDESVVVADARLTLFGLVWNASSEELFLVLVVVSGALGGGLASSTSFVDFIGNRSLVVSWLPWYLFRLPVSAGLSLIVYFAIRGGLLNVNAQGADLNPYAIVAISALTGLFSKQIMDFLKYWGDKRFGVRYFSSDGDEVRDDSILYPVPSVDAVEPPVLPVGSSSSELRLFGAGFVPESRVVITDSSGKSVPRDTTYLSADSLRVSLQPEDSSDSRILEVRVSNPTPGGGLANPIRVEVGGAFAAPKPSSS